MIKKQGSPLGNKNAAKPKPEHHKRVTITLPPPAADKLKMLGGSKWVAGKIEAAT